VRQADAIGGVHVERLHFRGAVAAGRGIAHVANANVAAQGIHIALVENIAHQSAALAHEQLAIFHRHDARGVLATML